MPVHATQVGVEQIAMSQFLVETRGRVTITATQRERFLKIIANAPVTMAGPGKTVILRFRAGMFAVGMVQRAVHLPLTTVVVIAKTAMKVPTVTSSHVAEIRVVEMVKQPASSLMATVHVAAIGAMKASVVRPKLHVLANAAVMANQLALCCRITVHATATMVTRAFTAKLRSRVIGLATEGERVLAHWPRTIAHVSVTPGILVCAVNRWWCARRAAVAMVCPKAPRQMMETTVVANAIQAMLVQIVRSNCRVRIPATDVVPQGEQ